MICLLRSLHKASGRPRPSASVSSRSFDNNDPFVNAATDVEVIARADRSARLRTGAVQLNFAARYLLRGKLARFEKRAASATVDSDFSRVFLGMPIVHGAELWPNKVGQSAVLKHPIICQIDL